MNRGRDVANSDHRSDLLYFVANSRAGEIWIGFNGGNSPDRPKQHKAYGYVEIARTSMGSIDTDPASHADANARFVQARIWYSKSQNGLRSDLPWEGNVWLNPPYGRGEGAAASFIRRLIRELDAGNVAQAVTCLNSDSMTSLWFRPVQDCAAVHLIVRGRPNFWRPGETGTSPTKGTVLSYFGAREDAFIAAAAAYGSLWRRIEREAA